MAARWCTAAAPRLQICTGAHIHTALSGTRAHTNYSQLSYYNQSHASANFIAAAYDSAAGADERRAARTSDGRKKRKTWPEQKHGADDSLKCSRIASMNRQLPFSNSSLGRFSPLSPTFPYCMQRHAREIEIIHRMHSLATRNQALPAEGLH